MAEVIKFEPKKVLSSLRGGGGGGVGGFRPFTLEKMISS